jgi:hypothetical protein
MYEDVNKSNGCTNILFLVSEAAVVFRELDRQPVIPTHAPILILVMNLPRIQDAMIQLRLWLRLSSFLLLYYFANESVEVAVEC